MWNKISHWRFLKAIYKQVDLNLIKFWLQIFLLFFLHHSKREQSPGRMPELVLGRPGFYSRREHFFFSGFHLRADTGSIPHQSIFCSYKIFHWFSNNFSNVQRIWNIGTFVNKRIFVEEILDIFNSVNLKKIGQCGDRTHNICVINTTL